jgi:hypothetical protein
MRFQDLKRASACLLFVWLAASIAWAQQLGPAAGGAITTAGADCSVVTRCFGFNVDGIPSIGLDIDIGTSATLAIEVSQSAASIFDDSATARWKAPPNGDAAVTADGAHYYGNQGFRWIRVRASAINGAISIIPVRGIVSGSAELSGDVMIDTTGLATSAKQDTIITSLQLMDNAAQTVAAGTAGTNSLLVGGVYNSSPITLTNGQGSGLQFDANGFTKVNLAAGLAFGAGSVSATVPRFTLASDDPAVALLDTIDTHTGDTADKIQLLLDGLSNAAHLGDDVGLAGDLDPVACEVGVIDGGAQPNVTTETKYNRFRCTPTGALQSVLTDYGGLIDIGANLNASIQATGSAVPTRAQYTGVNGPSGNIRGWTAVNPSGSIYAGQVDLASFLGSTVSATNAIPVYSVPSATTGWSVLNATAADGATACTSTVQSVKASPGSFGGYIPVNNPNTADTWLQVYNTASGSVTVGTTNPLMTVRIPGAAANSVAGNVEISQGVFFSSAIAIACTTTAGGNGNPSNAVELNVLYK